MSLRYEPEHEHFDVRFLFRAAREEHRRSDESLDVRWFRLQELHDARFDDSLMRAVRKLKRPVTKLRRTAWPGSGIS